MSLSLAAFVRFAGTSARCTRQNSLYGLVKGTRGLDTVVMKSRRSFVSVVLPCECRVSRLQDLTVKLALQRCTYKEFNED